MTRNHDRLSAEARFEGVFSHLGAVAAYARRRGSRDADALAAEVMTVAWRRLADVPTDDPRPWLYAAARNLVLAEYRRAGRATDQPYESEATTPGLEVGELDPALAASLHSLSHLDREALLLVAWEDLTPAQAAKALGINATAFRVRLLRARRRLRALLDVGGEDTPLPAPMPHLDVEGTR
jgi:RNA polymerase sigma-70 factor (ECF subfamily)